MKSGARFIYMKLNENSRNTRTLIVGFVIAIFVLVPLRFYEASNNADYESVLGTQNGVVILPESSSEGLEPYDELEAPYDQIETEGDVQGEMTEAPVDGALVLEKEARTCEPSPEVTARIEELVRQLQTGQFTPEESQMMIDEVNQLESQNSCQ